ncbi:MAG: flagellar M-ring protein FliF [Desulfobacteraceae bacterium 4572_187]|nr:MAG: flagellar M-ring protein FliF [Desulfobacteraceae bacterium 4572_187]
MSFNNFSIQLKALLKSLSPGKRIAFLSIITGTIIGFVFLMTWTEKPDFRYLYSNLDIEDASAIIEKLKEQKIEYQIASNGRAILVPEEKMHEIRLEMASQGLPQGGNVGFEVFNNTKIGMTEFVQNVNYQRALQGELSRTINKFKEVESSRVHIVMSPKSLFVDKEEPATASVVLKLRHGGWLNDNQIQGIVHLVSSSVPRLKPENVTVVDNSGKMLAGFKDRNTAEKISSNQLEFQEKLEKSMDNRVKTMLEKVLGIDNAIVRVSCLLNFKRREMTEERYFPDNKVVRSEQVLSETSGGSGINPRGIPGLRANISKREIKGKGDTLKYQKEDKTVNYEIGKTTSVISEPTGEVKRISVAVIVDGTYAKIKGKGGRKSWKYIPRPPEEMKTLENIVKRAVNFDPVRGDAVEVANIAFETDKLMGNVEEIKKEGWNEKFQKFKPVFKYTFLGIFLLFSFLFVVRPVTRWLTSNTLTEMDILKQLPKTVGELEREYSGTTDRLEKTDSATQLLETDRDVSVGVIRDWMKEKQT